MKVSPSLRQAYEKVHPVLERLAGFVEPRARKIAEKHHGAYSARIKEPESILIKAEKEGYQHPFAEMDDLFACTIAVPDHHRVGHARADVEACFEVVKVRQRDVKPEEFTYNDLSLYLKVKPGFFNRHEAYLDFIFELQIKTLLQRAWSQAGHDVIYKSARRTWGLARISSQLRALLEMADSVLANLEGAADALQPRVDYPKYSQTNDLVGILEETWAHWRLPAPVNRFRAAQVVATYLDLAGLCVADLPQLLGREDYVPYVKARSLAPTQAIFIVLFLERWGDMQGRLKKRSVLVTPEMLDLCPGLSKIPHHHRMVL